MALKVCVVYCDGGLILSGKFTDVSSLLLYYSFVRNVIHLMYWIKCIAKLGNYGFVQLMIHLTVSIDFSNNASIVYDISYSNLENIITNLKILLIFMGNGNKFNEIFLCNLLSPFQILIRTIHNYHHKNHEIMIYKQCI